MGLLKSGTGGSYVAAPYTNQEDDVYELSGGGQLQLVKPDSALSVRHKASLTKLNSTSSSNESVCSASSRGDKFFDSTTREDGPSPASHQHLLLPKKSQRKHRPELGQQTYFKEHLRVRTLYACLAENDGELSFEPNQIITNVRPSNEPGWLEGTLNGKSGLIPENYVEILP